MLAWFRRGPGGGEGGAWGVGRYKGYGPPPYVSFGCFCKVSDHMVMHNEWKNVDP